MFLGLFVDTWGSILLCGCHVGSLGEMRRREEIDLCASALPPAPFCAQTFLP